MERRPELVLKNVQTPGGRKADIAIRDGRVIHTGAGTSGDKVIDCTGLFVLPAAVDVHVHMRGGSQSAKEDWKTGECKCSCRRCDRCGRPAKYPTTPYDP